MVEFNLKTGRTHQIRVHCKYINHPIVGDEVYGVKDSTFKTNGQMLHAYKISFVQPTTGQQITKEIPYSEEITKALNKLRNNVL